MSDMLACVRCPALVQCRIQVVPGEMWVYKPPLPLLMVVARNPGKNEDEEGRPLVGKSGKLMRRILLPMQEYTSIYLTNMVKCFTPENRRPTDTELLNCREYIDNEVANLKPSIVLLTGLEAQAYKFGIGDRHKVRVDSDGVVYVATYHPAARMNVEALIRRDVWKGYMVWNQMQEPKRQEIADQVWKEVAEMPSLTIQEELDSLHL